MEAMENARHPLLPVIWDADFLYGPRATLLAPRPTSSARSTRALASGYPTKRQRRSHGRSKSASSKPSRRFPPIGGWSALRRLIDAWALLPPDCSAG